MTDHPIRPNGRCRGPSCGRPIIWCVTAPNHDGKGGGRRQPVDPAPDPDRGLLILTAADGDVDDRGRQVYRSRVETLLDVTDDSPRYLPHHASCPDVDAFRELQAINPGGELGDRGTDKAVDTAAARRPGRR